MAEQTAIPLAAPQLRDALRDHFLKPGDPRPGGVFLTEVTAPDRVHRADAIHVGLWASRGYTVDVCELKTSLSDFKRELDDPAKAEAWWKHSNTFWIVAPSTAIAPPEMLPKGWGLMVPGGRGRRFRIVVKAEDRELRPTTALLAALLVSMETDRNNEVERQRVRLVDQHRRQMQQVQQQVRRTDDPELRRRLARLEELEKACGFRLEDYDWGDQASVEVWGAALRDLIVQRRGQKEALRALDAMDASAARLRQALTDARKGLTEGLDSDG
jgi:hypothetical protein